MDRRRCVQRSVLSSQVSDVSPRPVASERASMTFGQSVTDGCLGWDTTVPVLEKLAESVRQRRARQ